MPTLGAPLDFAKLEARNMQAHQLGSAPSSPVKGQLYYNTGDNTLYWWDGTTWVSAKGGVSSIPDASPTVKGIVQLAGDLSGTAASPQIAPGVIVDADVAAANKDGAVATPSMRTLGAGAQQAMPGNRTLDAIIPPAADVSLNGKKITGLAEPISAQDAATKNYADSLAQGLDVKASVRAASTGNVATMSGPQTIDGVSLIAGQRVLLKQQAATADNGIYVVAAGAWSRAPDLDQSIEAPGAFVFVEEGTINADTGWVCTVDLGFAINVNAMPWSQFAGVGEYVGGAGLTLTGKLFDVGAGPGITVNTDSVQVANNGITNAMIADGAIDLGSADVANVLPEAKGGTGASATSAGGKSLARQNIGAAGVYTQNTHAAGTTITIPFSTHTLRATSALIVQCQIDATGQVVLPDVTVASNGDVTVTFAVSQSANTIRVTVIG